MSEIYDFDAVKKAVPIDRYLHDCGFDTKGNRFQCAWRDGTRFSGSFKSDTKDVWHDHNANEGGSVLDLAVKVEGLASVAEAAKVLGERYHIQPKESAKKVAPTFRDDVTYDYVDADGKKLFRVARQLANDKEGRKKDFRQWPYDLKVVGGQAIPCLNKGGTITDAMRVPYHLPELISEVRKPAAEQRPVLIVEGEKDADNLRALGLVATCAAQGAGKWLDKYRYSEHFKGARCVLVIADNDPALDENGHPHYKGQHHAVMVRESLAKVGVEAHVAYVESGKDASDWIDALRTEGVSDDAIKAKFIDLAENTPTWNWKPDESDREVLANVGIVFSDGEEFTNAELEQPDWIVNGFIARKMKGDLCAPSKTFKTYLVLQLAQSIAAGVPFLDKFKVSTPHKVAYFNLELFDWNFQERMRAEQCGLGISAEQLRGNLLVANLRANPTAIRGDDAERCMTCKDAAKCRGKMEYVCKVRHEREIYDALCRYLKSKGIEFIIVDPRYKVLRAGEDENTGDGLRGVLALRDALAREFAVLVVTHDPKGDTAEKKTTDRGAGSYVAGADYDFRLTIDLAEGWSDDNLVYVLDASQRARGAISKTGIRFDAERQTFFADADVSTEKATRKTLAQRENADRRAAKIAELQKAFKAAALEFVSRPEVFPSIEQFDMELAKVRGASVAINERPKYRKLLVDSHVLATCPEMDESTKKRKQHGKTFISTPERIANYLAHFQPTENQ